MVGETGRTTTGLVGLKSSRDPSPHKRRAVRDDRLGQLRAQGGFLTKLMKRQDATLKGWRYIKIQDAETNEESVAEVQSDLKRFWEQHG